MTSRTFIILMAICAALAGTSWYLLQPESSTGRKTNDRTGERLLSELPVADILRIDIVGPMGSVGLEKGETVWVVKDKFGYPADFPKLSDIVLKLRNMKIDRTFPASKDILDRLSLRPPEAASENTAGDDRGTRITLKGAGGLPLSDIIIGKAREVDGGRGGTFVIPAGENTVYAVDRDFRSLDTDAGRWIDRQLLDIPSEKIVRVDRLDPTDPAGETPLYTIQRAGKGKSAELLNVPEGQTVTPVKINRLMDTLAAFQVDDVIDPKTSKEKTGLDAGPCFKFSLFDGTAYTLCLGNTVDGNPDQTYLSAGVGFEAPAAAGDEAADPGETPAAEGGKTEAAPADPAMAAAAQNMRISPWIFTIPQWKADQLIADKADFFETPEKTED